MADLPIVQAPTTRHLSPQIVDPGVRCWPSSARPPLWLRALADGHPQALERVRRELRDLHAAWVASRWPAIMALFRADVGGGSLR